MTLDLPKELPVVAEICRQLEGLPLAIELAAARTSGLPLTDLLAGLQVNVADAAASAAARAGPAAQAYARYTQGECRVDTAPHEAITLVDQAAVLAQACEASLVEGIARLTVTSLRGRHGDPAEAIPGFTELIDR